MKNNQHSEKAVLVTGASGFLGRHLVGALLEAGAVVVAADCRPSELDAARREQFGDRYRFVELDLRRDDVGRALGDDRYRAVVHLASFVPKSTAATGGHAAAEVHDGVLGITLRLLDALGGKTGHLILASSVSVYGSAVSGVFAETDVPVPTDLYGVYKLACEGVFRCFAASEKIRATCLRFAQIYGPGEPHGSFLQRVFIPRGMNNESIKLVRGGRDERDLLWVEDAATAIAQVLKSSVEGIYNVATGKGVAVRRMAGIIQECSGRNFPMEIMDGGEPALIRIYDISAAKAAFDFDPKVSVSEGIRRLCIA